MNMNYLLLYLVACVMELRIKREQFVNDGVLRSEGLEKCGKMINGVGNGCGELGWGEIGDGGEFEKWECDYKW
jgi:hypothetical protein